MLSTVTHCWAASSSALDSWSVRRRLADIELGWLLDGDV
jgi:hypothetical protein